MDLRLLALLPVGLALLVDKSHASASIAQAWPPFVLVAGLLLVGLVAGADGLFDATAARLAALGGPPVLLLGAAMALVAAVTAVLNLDTSVVFLTPVLIATARRRGLDTAPFLYASVFIANASSLYLPGSNLTNLLVLSHAPVAGATFFARMLPMALAASLLTAAGIVLPHRRAPFGVQAHGVEQPASSSSSSIPLRRGAGLWGTLLAAVLVALLANAALPVLALGIVLVAVRARGGELGVREATSRLGLPTLIQLFAFVVVLGTLARSSALPAELLHGAGSASTAAIAALGSVLINNLPAAAVLSTARNAHPSALLLGLNVGPNLAVTGSLAVLLWWRGARTSGVRPSILAYSRQGLLLAPLAMLGALAIGSA